MKQDISFIHATIRGDKPEDIPNQDYIQVHEDETLFIVSVSDGLGSSIFSKEGAQIACECVIDAFKKANSSINCSQLSELLTINWQDRIEQKQGQLKDYRTANSFIIVFKSEGLIVSGQLGDVMISLRIDGLFMPLETTQKDFSNETECLGSNRNEPYRILKYEFQQSFDFLIATDGIGDEIDPMKLNAFQNYLKNKFQNESIEVMNRKLRVELETIMKDKNNDDKSLVFAWTN